MASFAAEMMRNQFTCPFARGFNGRHSIDFTSSFASGLRQIGNNFVNANTYTMVAKLICFFSVSKKWGPVGNIALGGRPIRALRRNAETPRKPRIMRGGREPLTLVSR
jgi:hypothetical protein